VETIVNSGSTAAPPADQFKRQGSKFSWVGSLPKFDAPFVVKRGNRRIWNWSAIGINLLWVLCLISVLLPVMLKGLSFNDKTEDFIQLFFIGGVAVYFTVRVLRGIISPLESLPAEPAGATGTTTLQSWPAILGAIVFVLTLVALHVFKPTHSDQIKSDYIGQASFPKGDAMEPTLPTSAFQIRLVAEDSETNIPTDTLTNYFDKSHFERLRVMREVLLDGKAVERAGWSADSDGHTNIMLGLTETGSQQYEALTAANLKHRIAVVFQGRVLFAPIILDRISSRSLELIGKWERQDLERTVNGLNQMKNPVTDLQFGPEQENILPPLIGSWTFLNLRSNHLITMPPNLHPFSESRTFHDWQRDNGADLAAPVSDKSPQLRGYGMVITTAGTNDWDTSTLSDIWYNWNLMVNEPEAEARLAKIPGKAQGTYYFRTRDDTWGILQIIGFTKAPGTNFIENPSSVKIRYKLVQQNTKATAVQVDDEVTRLKLQIADNELDIAKRKFKIEVVSQAANDLSASNIVVLMKLAYATIYTYRDTGWTVSQNGDYVWTNNFNELLGRRNLYRIEVVTAENPFSQTNRWWSDGATEFWQSGTPAIFKNSNPASESSNISLVNQDSTVPALFFNLNWGNILNNLAFSSATELVRQKDEAVSGVDCYVLEQANRGWTVWVGKQDFLIRRYRNFISKAAVAEAMKHTPKPITNSVHSQADITIVQTHENVVVNEHLSKDAFLPATVRSGN
jgi:hypothetical protein